MEMNDLVSVIIPVFNVEKYLYRCLDTVIGQTYKKLEIILVDDGSTDSSGRICDAYAGKDSRVQVIHKKNGGLSDARNTGIAQCTGSYCVLIDSDDFIHNSFVQEMYVIAKSEQLDLVCTEMYSFKDGNEDNVFEGWGTYSDEDTSYCILDVEDALEKYLYQRYSITASQQKLYKRELFENIQFPVGKYYEDQATTYRFIIKAGRIAVITNKRLYAYRNTITGIMNQKFSFKKLDCIGVGESLYSDVASIFPALRPAAACAAFRVNRLVFYQIPRSDKDSIKAVWEEVKKYRKTMLTDKKIQFYEKILAFSSYTGKFFFICTLKIFQKLRVITMDFRMHGH